MRQPQAVRHPLPATEGDLPFRQMADVLRLLGNANRLMILNILAQSPQSVTTIHQLINEHTNLSQSSLSQHLALLRAYKFVDFEKQGQRATYFICNDRVSDLFHALESFNQADN
ncbi:ArsR/SmtB family transcription factor [Peptococcus simiae]|uniref:ArsR/SmtB family transcription factor n=1 Tax=Peptococcus simiae TaxID=1643805 RepID=A0ABW9H0C9_9FIRM